MKKMLVVIIAVVLTCACAYAADLDPNFVKTYDTSKGVVTFNHQSHAETLMECAGCHGQLEAYGGVNKKFAHTACKECHKAMGSDYPNSPVRCTGCHVK